MELGGGTRDAFGHRRARAAAGGGRGLPVPPLEALLGGHDVRRPLPVAAPPWRSRVRRAAPTCVAVRRPASRCADLRRGAPTCVAVRRSSSQGIDLTPGVRRCRILRSRKSPNVGEVRSRAGA